MKRASYSEFDGSWLKFYDWFALSYVLFRVSLAGSSLSFDSHVLAVSSNCCSFQGIAVLHTTRISLAIIPHGMITLHAMMLQGRVEKPISFERNVGGAGV